MSILYQFYVNRNARSYGILENWIPVSICFSSITTVTIPLNHLVHLLVGKISKHLHWGDGQEGVARKDIILDDTLRLAQSIFTPYNLEESFVTPSSSPTVGA